MRVNLLGVQELNFTSSSSGEIIKGLNLFVAFSDENVKMGYRTEKFFVRENIPVPKVEINEEIELVFNHRGRIERIEKVDE